MNDKMVEWLFRNPLSDGGTFTGVADIVSKYGLVPKDVMPETNSSENTSRMAGLITLKLREQGIWLLRALNQLLWRKRKLKCSALSTGCSF